MHHFHLFRRLFHHGHRAGLVLIALSLFAANADACCTAKASAVVASRTAVATCACATPAISMVMMPVTYLQTYYVQPVTVATVVVPMQTVAVQPQFVPAPTVTPTPAPPLPAPPPLPPERSVAAVAPAADTQTTTTTTTTTTHESAASNAVGFQQGAVGVEQVGVMGVVGMARKLTLRERLAMFRESRSAVVIEQQAVVSTAVIAAPRVKRCRLF